jgi:hypothetical protein
MLTDFGKEAAKKQKYSSRSDSRLGRFAELARVLVRFDHVASSIANANDGVMLAAVRLCISDCVRNFGVPQPTEWQRIGDQIDAATILTRADFVNVF